MRWSNRSGFTLIELLIVVVIIGILAAIAIPKYSAVRQRGQVAAVQSDLRNLSIAEERHHMQNLTYTSSVADLEFQTSSGVTITINEATTTGWSATATHAGDAAIQCGMFVGTAVAGGGAPATSPEAVACTF